jgi:hypothetical protein
VAERREREEREKRERDSTSDSLLSLPLFLFSLPSFSCAALLRHYEREKRERDSTSDKE